MVHLQLCIMNIPKSDFCVKVCGNMLPKKKNEILKLQRHTQKYLKDIFLEIVPDFSFAVEILILHIFGAPKHASLYSTCIFQHSNIGYNPVSTSNKPLTRTVYFNHQYLTYIYIKLKTLTHTHITIHTLQKLPLFPEFPPHTPRCSLIYNLHIFHNINSSQYSSTCFTVHIKWYLNFPINR